MKVPKIFILKWLLPALVAIAAVSCKDATSGRSGDNGVYYWRTTFSLNNDEQDFLKDHNVKRLYVKMFDVDNSWSGRPEPEATLQFVDTLPRHVEVVPTVYITNSAMGQMQLKEEEYAEKIVRRVTAMCLQNSIDFKELQLDCDWTKNTRDYFFKLCREIKTRLDSTQQLSSTIRLHQLSQSPPPVDKGVLMVYNTGNLAELTTDNSIFSYDDIKPYLRNNRLAKYPLRLDVAYPAYGWSVAFRKDGNGVFHCDGLMHRTDFSDIEGIKKKKKNLYVTTKNVDLYPVLNQPIYLPEGSMIRVERPSAKEILKVKALIDNQLKDKPHNNIIYHLDSDQLSHYSDNEISKIYSLD